MQLTFCILVLYISILLNSPIVSNDLSVDSLGVSILLFTNNKSFISFFPNHMPLIYFSHIITLTKTSHTILIKNNDSGHSYLVSEFTGNTFKVSLRITLCYYIFLIFIYLAVLGLSFGMWDL